MEVIKCPECGNENVSENTEACPVCGYGIKARYDRLKREKQEERIAEEHKRVQMEKEQQHQENMNRYFGTPIKKFIWGILACGIVFLLVRLTGYIYKESKTTEAIVNSKDYIDEIKCIVSNIDYELSNADYVYGTILSQEAIDEITEDLQEMGVFMNAVDKACKEDTRIVDEIDSYIGSNTAYKSWEKYKSYLNVKYFIKNSKEESADELVKKYAYSSAEELREEQRKTSLIVEEYRLTTVGDNYKIYGSVTNNTSKTVYFVKVKVSLKDEDYKVIDSETTYACGDEGIRPGDSCKFECYIEKDSEMEYYSAEIYDYD